MDDKFGELMARASEALERQSVSRDRSTVLREEVAELEKLSKQHYDDAHGKNFSQWEKEAAEATRLRIAAEVLRDRVEGDRDE